MWTLCSKLGNKHLNLNSNTTDATSGAGTAYHSGVHPQFIVGFVLLYIKFLCNVW